MISTIKKLLTLFLLIALMGCSEKGANVTVSGAVKGLKKGTIYLERAKDTSLMVLDSMIINGEPEFLLQTRLEEPEVLFLRLDIGQDEQQRLRFFADSGTTYVNTSLKRFIFDAKIEGSDEQELLTEFDELFGRFNDQRLDLIKKQLEAASDSIELAKISDQLNNLERRKYLSAINFALRHKNSGIAPYIAINEIFDANPKLLDTIYKSLSPEISRSKYGLALKELLDESASKEN